MKPTPASKADNVRYHTFTRPEESHPLNVLLMLYLDVGLFLDSDRAKCLTPECPDNACRDSLGLAPYSPQDLSAMYVLWEDVECEARVLMVRAGIPPMNADTQLRRASRAFDLAWKAHEQISECWAKEFPPREVDSLEIRERKPGERRISQKEANHIKAYIANWPAADRRMIEVGIEQNTHSIKLCKVTRDCETQRIFEVAKIRNRYVRSCRAMTVPIGGELTKRLYELMSLTSPAFWDSGSAEGATPSRVHPVWDRKKRELRFKGEVVRKYSGRLAPIQFKVLDELEKHGWPLGGVKIESTSPLKDIIRNLNLGLVKDTIRFSGDGTSDGVDWKLAKDVMPKSKKRKR